MDRYFDSVPYPQGPMTELERLAVVCSRELRKIEYDEYIQRKVDRWMEKPLEERMNGNSIKINSMMPSAPVTPISYNQPFLLSLETTEFIGQNAPQPDHKVMTELAAIAAQPAMRRKEQVMSVCSIAGTQGSAKRIPAAFPCPSLLPHGAYLYGLPVTSTQPSLTPPAQFASQISTSASQAFTPKHLIPAFRVVPTPINPLRCPLCAKDFTKAIKLREHIISHPETVEPWSSGNHRERDRSPLRNVTRQRCDRERKGQRLHVRAHSANGLPVRGRHAPFCSVVGVDAGMALQRAELFPEPVLDLSMKTVTATEIAADAMLEMAAGTTPSYDQSLSAGLQTPVELVRAG